MDLLVLADIDDLRWRGGRGSADALLSCGDVMDEVILEAADAFGCDAVFAVKGNHDPRGLFRPPIIDVHLHCEPFRGIRIGGFNGCRRYKPRGHYLYEDAEVEALLGEMPAVDVFVAHNCPAGIHEGDPHVHRGFAAFRRYIVTHRPCLFFHGHQHTDAETRLGPTRVMGVYGHRMARWEDGGNGRTAESARHKPGPAPPQTGESRNPCGGQ